jgi:PAS domain S-box-containing protein
MRDGEDRDFRKQRLGLILRPGFVVSVTLVLALILVSSALIEYHASRREVLETLSGQAASLIEAIAVSSDNASLAYQEIEGLVGERLLDNARLIRRLSKGAVLTRDDLARISEENNLYRINVFDARGGKVASSHEPVHEGGEELHDPREYLTPLLEGAEEELLMGFKESRFGMGERFSAAVRLSGGGAVVVNVDAEEMLRLRREIGVGRLIDDVAGGKGILYIVLQDSAGIIAASKNVKSMTRISSDLFLENALESRKNETRLTEYEGERIFETVAPFSTDGDLVGLLRVGLDASRIERVEESTVRRLVLISAILLVGGVLLFGFLMVHQNYRLLDEAYLRARTHSGKVLDNMADAVVALDREGRITVFNRAAEAVFSLKEKDVLGKRPAEVMPGGTVLEEALRTGENLKDREIECTVSERRSLLSFTTSPIRNRQGAIDSLVALIRDLTERRALEESLRRREKLSAMGELASGVAHEVRNPLNAISMIAQRLEREFTPEEGEGEYRALTGTVVKESRRLGEIIQRFLRLARPPKPELALTDLGLVIEEVSHIVSSEVQAKGVVLEKDLAPMEPVLLDRNQMKQVVLNIVQNSLHATPRGGTIRIMTGRGKSGVTITVSDTGHGIPRENLDKIFDLYFTTKSEGTGMGLAIAHQIVMIHGGHIEVESEPGKGAIFRIHLPSEERSHG